MAPMYGIPVVLGTRYVFRNRTRGERHDGSQATSSSGLLSITIKDHGSTSRKCQKASKWNKIGQFRRNSAKCDQRCAAPEWRNIRGCYVKSPDDPYYTSDIHRNWASQLSLRTSPDSRVQICAPDSCRCELQPACPVRLQNHHRGFHPRECSLVAIHQALTRSTIFNKDCLV